jgi:C-terminal processing protease CtpA/Prc
MRVEPAHGLWGLGFKYELSASAVSVSRVLPESPAYRAGIRQGDDVVQIQGKKVDKMESGEAQSLINANAQVGIDLLLRSKDGAERHVLVKEGIIYPSVEDDLPLVAAH